MKHTDINLLVENYQGFKKISSTFTHKGLVGINAFSLAVKNKKVDGEKLRKAIEIIKKNTSMFSSFRGTNINSIAIAIAEYDDMEEAFSKVKDIYKKLKTKFSGSEYLALTATLLLPKLDKIDIDKVITDTKKTYDLMVKNHRFLTGTEDVTAATMLALTSENIEEKIERTEVYYKKLKEKGYWSGNGLQTLSHLLVLFDGEVDSNIEKVIAFDKELKKSSVKITSTTLPLLGVTAFLDLNAKDFVAEVNRVDDELLKVKGFGNFSMGREVRNMISFGLVASNSLKGANISEEVLNTANTIAITIQTTMEIAMTMAMTAGIIAATTAASS